jgi:hypothetical protein
MQLLIHDACRNERKPLAFSCVSMVEPDALVKSMMQDFGIAKIGEAFETGGNTGAKEQKNIYEST